MFERFQVLLYISIELTDLMVANQFPIRFNTPNFISHKTVYVRRLGLLRDHH